MIEFNIKIAEKNFSIKTRHEDTYALCKDYLSDEKGMGISITQKDIEFEREKSKKEAIIEGIPIYDYSDGYLETISVYRKIADYFSYNDSAVFHGALIERNGEGYLFTAKSGTGKTTHIMNWIKAFPDTRIINGDKPILTAKNNMVTAFGTPWSGKEGYNINSNVKLKAIIILKRDLTNHIEQVLPNVAIATILSQTYRPSDSMGMKRALEFAIKVTENVKIFSLGCNMDVESAIVAYNGMNK